MPQWSNPLGTLQQQYGSPHLPRLDSGGLAYRPSGVYSMNDQRMKQLSGLGEQERQRQAVHNAYLRQLMQYYFTDPKNRAKNPPSLAQIMKGMR